MTTLIDPALTKAARIAAFEHEVGDLRSKLRTAVSQRDALDRRRIAALGQVQAADAFDDPGRIAVLLANLRDTLEVNP